MPRRPSEVNFVDNDIDMDDAIHADRPFAAATFSDYIDNAHSDESDVEDDIPRSLATSRSNVPGMTPAELLQAHRQSLADVMQVAPKDIDMHSLTLSRHQVESTIPDQFNSMTEYDENMHRQLESYTFGNSPIDSNGSLHS